jgi:cytochrome P450
MVFYLDERLFTHADKFIPERWTTKKELTKDPSLFVPFSIGDGIPKSRMYLPS